MKMAFRPSPITWRRQPRYTQHARRTWATPVKVDEEDGKRRRRKQRRQKADSIRDAKEKDQPSSPKSSQSRAAKHEHSRRAFLASAGVLASLAVAGKNGLTNPVDAARPMRRDKEVWAPLEDYMVVNERIAQTT